MEAPHRRTAYAPLAAPAQRSKGRRLQTDSGSATVRRPSLQRMVRPRCLGHGSEQVMLCESVPPSHILALAEAPPQDRFDLSALQVTASHRIQQQA